MFTKRNDDRTETVAALILQLMEYATTRGMNPDRLANTLSRVFADVVTGKGTNGDYSDWECHLHANIGRLMAADPDDTRNVDW
jgi:hypothetical protein